MKSFKSDLEWVKSFQTFHSLLIGSDCGAFNSHVVLENGVGSVDGHLVIGLVAEGQSQVVVEAFDLKEWEVFP